MIYYNLDKLVKITCNDFRKSGYYYYMEEKKFLGMICTEEGIYSIMYDDSPYNGIPECHILKNKTVYEKPCVTLYYSNKIDKEYYFETYDEAKEFTEEIKSKTGVWIQ